MVGPFGEIFVGDPAVLQISQFRRGQRQLFGQFHRLGADLGRDLVKGRFNRHSRFHTDQQKVEGVREGAHHRLLPFGRQIGDVEVGRIIAQHAETECETVAGDGWQTEIIDHEQIEQGAAEHHERCREAEEVEGHGRAIAAQAGLGQLGL